VASERRVIARHAATVLVGQLAVMAFGVTDTIVAGRYAEGALAALSVGSAIFISVFVSLMGVLQALLPVWAELHGAGRTPEVGRSVRQSLYLCGITIVLGMAVLLFPAPMLGWTEVPQSMRADVEAYLRIDRLCGVDNLAGAGVLVDQRLLSLSPAERLEALSHAWRRYLGGLAANRPVVRARPMRKHDHAAAVRDHDRRLGNCGQRAIDRFDAPGAVEVLAAHPHA